MKTNTETNNFKPVTVSTVVVEGKVETIIFFNGMEIWQTNTIQDVEKQHQIGVKVAETYTLIVGGENRLSQPWFGFQ